MAIKFLDSIYSRVVISATAVVVGFNLWGPSVSGQTVATDQASLSRQAFVELSNVLKHPRCINCHTSAGFPRQGDDQHRHTLNVSRGIDDKGAEIMRCGTCHQSANQSSSGVPGAPNWRLAPLRMAWEGLSIGELCRALLDPQRGGMTRTTFVEHLQKEKLVLWAWQPGRNSAGEERARPPLSHKDFVALAREWVGLGGKCPD